MLLRASDRRSQPWKNGGGITTEVYCFPPGSGIDDFEWRISIAEVATAGPFSRFPGVDRVLTVLSGALELRFEGESRPRVLTDASDPYRFDGETPCQGRPHNGTARDLNVMVRRAAWSVEVEHVRLDEHSRALLHANGPAALLVLNACKATCGDQVLALAPLDALLLQEAATPLRITGSIGDRALFACFRRV